MNPLSYSPPSLSLFPLPFWALPVSIFHNCILWESGYSSFRDVQVFLKCIINNFVNLSFISLAGHCSHLVVHFGCWHFSVMYSVASVTQTVNSSVNDCKIANSFFNNYSNNCIITWKEPQQIEYKNNIHTIANVIFSRKTFHPFNRESKLVFLHGCESYHLNNVHKLLFLRISQFCSFFAAYISYHIFSLINLSGLCISEV